MTLGTVTTGDIVKVRKLGRLALAEVTGRTQDGLLVRPLGKGFTWRSVTAREVVGIWRATKATRDGGVRAHV